MRYEAALEQQLVPRAAVVVFNPIYRESYYDGCGGEAWELWRKPWRTAHTVHKKVPAALDMRFGPSQLGTHKLRGCLVVQSSILSWRSW